MRNAGKGYVSFRIEDPRPGLWTIEVATARTRHTPYTVGGFVRSPLALSLKVPSLIRPGQPIDVAAVVSDQRGPLRGVKVQTSVLAPRASVNDLLTKYGRRLSSIRIPGAFRRDGGPDKARHRLAQLVMLRDKLVAEGRDDILAPVKHELALGTASIAAPEDWLNRLVGFTATNRSSTGTSAEAATSGAAPTAGGTPAIGGATTGATNLGSVFDPRTVQRPVRTGVAGGRFGRTETPGSYSVMVTATGFSPTCGTRFVRHDMASVVVGSRKGID